MSKHQFKLIRGNFSRIEDGEDKLYKCGDTVALTPDEIEKLRARIEPATGEGVNDPSTMRLCNVA